MKEKAMRGWQSWILAIALAGSCLFAYGQGPGPTPMPAPGQQSIGPHRTMEALGEMRSLTQQLAVTPEQREKLRPIVNEEGEQLRVTRLDEHLTPDQKRQKSLEIRAAFQPKIAALLTPEQQEKFKKMQEAYQGKRPEGTKSGEPATAPAPPK
jgi:Spy/CpxP family protein refolding chaperone